MLNVVDQLPGLERILFYNFGEPFLHKHAIAFLRQVRSRRPDVTLQTSTNGLVLTDAAIDAIASEALADKIATLRALQSGSPTVARAAELLNGGDTYSALTCDSRLRHLWKHRGVAGRYLAKLSLDRTMLAGSADTRVAAMLTVENLSSSVWSQDSEDPLRIGLLLRSNEGRVLEELPGIPLPREIPPGGKETVLVDVRLPLTPGEYQLFIDVVEERVCWFSDRSSPPLVCNIRVEASGGREWDYETLVETIYEALLGRPAGVNGLQCWGGLLSEGLSLEPFLTAFVAAASSENGFLQQKKPAARRALLSMVDAGSPQLRMPLPRQGGDSRLPKLATTRRGTSKPRIALDGAGQRGVRRHHRAAERVRLKDTPCDRADFAGVVIDERRSCLTGARVDHQAIAIDSLDTAGCAEGPSRNRDLGPRRQHL
jgi:hypothetical protein